MSGVDMVLLTYREETKQPQCPIAGLPLLEFSPALESWSDPIFTRPTSCLIIPEKFSSFVFYPPSLSVCHSARLFTEHCSISWVDTPLNADWLHVYFGIRPRLSSLKRFWKIAYPAFKWKEGFNQIQSKFEIRKNVPLAVKTQLKSYFIWFFLGFPVFYIKSFFIR